MSRARALIVSSFLVVATGCSLSSEGTADPTSFGVPPGSPSDDGAVVSDGSAPADDTSAPIEDSAPPAIDSTIDASVEDTSIDDTGAPDTGTPDTGAPDTGAPDTGTPDTGTPDTGPPDTGTPVGVLVGSGAAGVTGTISLSTIGTLDWAHWGLVNAGSFNHKSGASLITKGTTGGGPIRHDDYPISFSWTGGDPTANVTSTKAGIYHDKKNEHFTFEAAASEVAERTLQIWVTWNGANGTVSARLTDDSAPEWTGNLPIGAMGTWIQPASFTFKFRSAKPGQKLVIKVTQTTDAGYISLLAAALK